MSALRLWTSLGAAGAALVLSGCLCAGRPAPAGPGKNPYLRAVEADLAEAARGWVDGRLTGRQYQDLSTDRAAKARRYRDDAKWRAAATKGDRDKDGVPDPLDGCASSPTLSPTDERGCPPPVRPECATGEVQCPEPAATADARLRDLLEKATFLIDPRCDGAEAPSASNPLAWGKAAGDANAFVFQVGRSTATPAACQLYYEMEFRIELLHLGPETPVRFITVLFRGQEDLTPLDSRRATFRISFPETVTEARSDLWGALMNAGPVRWRVRAVNGAQGSSPWSPMKEKRSVAGGIAL